MIFTFTVFTNKSHTWIVIYSLFLCLIEKKLQEDSPEFKTPIKPGPRKQGKSKKVSRIFLITFDFKK